MNDIVGILPAYSNAREAEVLTVICTLLLVLFVIFNCFSFLLHFEFYIIIPLLTFQINFSENVSHYPKHEKSQNVLYKAWDRLTFSYLTPTMETKQRKSWTVKFTLIILFLFTRTLKISSFRIYDLRVTFVYHI